MIVGFDLDGTLTHKPALVELFNSLRSAGHRVIIISGWPLAKTEAEKKQAYDRKKKQLAILKLADAELIVAFGATDADRGTAKTKICKDLGIQLYIDNQLSHAKPISSVCTSLLII